MKWTNAKTWAIEPVDKTFKSITLVTEMLSHSAKKGCPQYFYRPGIEMKSVNTITYLLSLDASIKDVYP